jgi:circadian clock protein KaiC
MDPLASELERANERLSTGVPGFDTVLGGGLVEPGLYLLQGVPGAGKTILASQIAFHRTDQGDRALFVTLVAESHAKLLSHLRGFAFFDETAIAERLWFLSALAALAREGLDGLLQFLAKSLRQYRPRLLVIDGFASVQEFTESAPLLARFMHELNGIVTATRCTALLLAPGAGNTRRPEHTVVDGLIELDRIGRNSRRANEVEVHKMRGGKHLTGRSTFTITDGGIRVFPRLETVVSEHRIRPRPHVERVSTGLPALDEITRGGLARGSSTSLLGAPGKGKTLLGLTFLCAGARAGEKGLYFGFYESPERLVAKAESIGQPLAELARSGRIDIHWLSPLEQLVDEIGWRIDEAVNKEGIGRVFIDGLEGLLESAMHPERVPQFVTALSVLLRSRGVTTMFSEELPLFSEAVHSKVLSTSALVENIFIMRYFEHEAELRRLLAVLKTRESDFDPSIREFRITATGLALGEQLVGLDQLMRGRSRATAPSAPPPSARA